MYKNNFCSLLGISLQRCNFRSVQPPPGSDLTGGHGKIRIKDRQKCAVCCSTKNTFYPFEGEKLTQHLEKCSGMNKKQLQATSYKSRAVSEHRDFGSCTQTREEKRSPVSCWVSCTGVIVTFVCRHGAVRWCVLTPALAFPDGSH